MSNCPTCNKPTSRHYQGKSCGQQIAEVRERQIAHLDAQLAAQRARLASL